jgi:type I restriction enzyme S subunit
LIPADWEITTVSEICKLQNGHGFRPPDWSDRGYPIIRIQNLNGSPTFNYFEGTPDPKWLVPPGQILFAWAGTKGASFGPTIWNGPTGVLNQHIFKVFPVKGVDRDWLYIALRHVTDRIEAKAHGFKATLVHVKKSDIDRHSVLLPPIREQRCIASTLATWDRAIETVESLIANARAQKRALMQQLLPQGTTPPKKRLPGFSGELRETTIEDVASVLVSNVDKKSVKGERPVRLCNYMDVYRSDQIVTEMDFMAATATEAQIRKFGLMVGDVIITKDSETPDDIAISTIVRSTSLDLVCGYHLAILRPKEATDGQFLKFFFEHPGTRHFFASRANGATRFGLTVGAIETAPINLPSHAEQKEIGNVILTAEIEIHRLNPILSALRQEKAALMQQLLTGKRRVKLPDNSTAESEVAR